MAVTGVGSGHEPARPENAAAKPVLLVLASTYPRWRNDSEPGFVHELARRLVGHFRVLVVCPHAPGAAVRERLDGVDVVRYRYAPARWETLVNDGGMVANLRRRRWKWLLVPLFVLGQLWVARRLIRRERVAVIHAHWLLPQGLLSRLAVAGRSSLPVLLTSHGADLHSLRGRLGMAAKRWAAAGAAAITVVSQAMVDKVVALGVDPARVRVAPMGVDLLDRFSPADPALRGTDELLFVGRLVEKKGLPVVIAALPAVALEVPSVHLTVIGFGPDEAALRRQVEALGLQSRVHFAGAVAPDRLPEHYRRAALFVAPFIQARDGDEEGLGLVVVEAIGCLCPVLVSDLPATRDVVDDGVPAGDVQAWAARIVAALTSPAATRLQLAQRRRDLLMARMSWDTVAAGYRDQLMALAEQPL